MKTSPFAVDTVDERRLVLPKFRERALGYAFSRGVKAESAEEFASFAMIDYLQTGRHDMHWHLVDYLRQEVGRVGTRGYETQRELRNTVHLDEVLEQKLPAPEHDLGPSREVASLMLLIPDERTRAIFRLYLEGYKLAEIGTMIGKTRASRRGRPTAARKVWMRNRKGKLVRRLPKDGAPGGSEPVGVYTFSAISESRVSQLMTAAIARIRRRLGLPPAAVSMREFDSMTATTELRECAGGCGEQLFVKPGSDRWFIKGHEGGRCTPSVGQTVRPVAPEREPVVVDEDDSLRERYEAKSRERAEAASPKPPRKVSVFMDPKDIPAIEKNVPLPPRLGPGRGGALKELASKMQEHDSVLLPKKQASTVAQALRNMGMKSTMRTVDAQNARVWCLGPATMDAEPGAGVDMHAVTDVSASLPRAAPSASIPAARGVFSSSRPRLLPVPPAPSRLSIPSALRLSRRLRRKGSLEASAYESSCAFFSSEYLAGVAVTHHRPQRGDSRAVVPSPIVSTEPLPEGL